MAPVSAIAFLIICCGTIPAICLAQQPTKKEALPDAPPVDLREVDAARKKAAASTTLSAAVKKQIDELYELAASQIAEAEKLELQTKNLKQELADAPNDLKTQQALLSAKTKPATPDTSKWTLEQLQSKTTEAETAATTAQQNLQKIQAEIARRAARRTNLAKLQEAAAEALNATLKKLQAAPPKDDPAAITVAKRTLLRATQRYQIANIAFLEQEAQTYTGTSRVWTAREDVARRELARATEFEQLLKRELGDRQKRKADALAEAAREAALNAHPAVKPAADRNSSLFDMNAQMVAAVEKTRRDFEAAETEKNTLERQFVAIRKRAEIAQYSRAIGQLLRTQNAKLPDTYAIRDRIRLRQRLIADINLRMLEWESERQEWLDTSAAVKRGMQNVPASTPDRKRQEISEELARVATQRLQILGDLIDNSGKHLDRLVALDTTERGLVEVIDTQRKFIAEHILWVRSANHISLLTVERSWSNVGTLFSAAHWQETWNTISSDAIEEPFWPICCLGLFGWLVIRRGVFKRKLREYGQLAGKRNCTSLRPTLRALVLTVLISAPVPVLLAFIGWRLSTGAIPESFVGAMGTTLLFVAGIHAALELIHQACRTDGLGPAHFAWHSQTVSAVRSCVYGLQIAVVPLTAIVVLTEAHGHELILNSVGRLAYLASQVVLGLALFRLLRPSSSAMSSLISKSTPGLLVNTFRIWTTILIGGPFLLAVISAIGYHYTAIQLTFRLITTFGLFIALAAVRALLLRWLLVTHREVAIKRHRERLAAASEIEDANKQPDIAVPNLADAIPEVGLSDIKQQTRDLIRIAATVALIGGTWLIWADILPALGVFNRFQLWPNTLESGGEGTPTVWITLGDLLLSVIIAILTFVAARNVPGFAEMTVLKRLPLDAGARYAATSVTRYLIVMIGLIFSVRLIGIGWSSVQWLAAAITVGLGFGMQEIFANFVSGMIMLFERPVRVGDTVTVGDITGTVTRIRIRATTILDWDNKELIVPNKQFVTGNLVNWTLSNSNLRLVLAVGIAYGSDTRLATQLLYKVAKDNPSVMQEPPPVVVFKRFGDSCLEMELRVFVAGVSQYRQLIHELNQAVDDEFKQHDIVIAFPQRDLHIRSVPEDLTSARFQTKQQEIESAVAPDSIYTAEKMESIDVPNVDDLESTISPDATNWIDVRGLGDEKIIRRIGEIFRIHPLALEDIVNVPQRPKAESYDEHLLLVVRMVHLGETGTPIVEQVSLVLGENYVLTVQEGKDDGDVFDPIRKRIASRKGRHRTNGADYLFYTLADSIIDGYYPVLEQLGDRLESLEEEIIRDPQPSTLAVLNRMRTELLKMRRAAWPQREAVNSLIHDESSLVNSDTRLHLRDVYDHCVQTSEVIEMYREMASGLMSTYLSAIANRTNEIMKGLAAAAEKRNLDEQSESIDRQQIAPHSGSRLPSAILAAATVAMLGFVVPAEPIASKTTSASATEATAPGPFSLVAFNSRQPAPKPVPTFPFPGTVAKGAKLVEVYADPRFFEGPTADPKTGTLYFTAFGKDNQQILRLDGPGKVTVWLDKTEGVNGTFLSKNGRLLGAQAFGHRVMSYDFGKDGPTTRKVLLYDKTLNQPNDVCQAPNGDIYFSDPDFKKRKTSAVYRLAPNGKTTKVVTDMPVPNGVITSLDGKTLYVGDSHLMLWRSYPIKSDGTVGPGKVFFHPKTALKIAPDGMTIDEKGNLYFSGCGGVWVVQPDGEPLGLIPVPEFCSNAGFGGKDGKTLYLTCSKKVYSLRMNVRGGRIK
eukprot:g21941.t1